CRHSLVSQGNRTPPAGTGPHPPFPSPAVVTTIVVAAPRPVSKPRRRIALFLSLSRLITVSSCHCTHPSSRKALSSTTLLASTYTHRSTLLVLAAHFCFELDIS